MSRGKERPNRGLKLEIKVIPAKYLDLPLAEIAQLMGNGSLLWPGGAGRAQGLKFVTYDIKKKRGRKPKALTKSARPAVPGSADKTST
ncbi:MAG: hypothetical protein Q8M54_07530 [Desulfobaccales bacterium]|nr:hypothetical protein [Desulfobaccales bacterium]